MDSSDELRKRLARSDVPRELRARTDQSPNRPRESDRPPAIVDRKRDASGRERLERLERIAERDSMRHLRDFSPERERQVEDFEIRTNPDGFARRHRGEGLDTETKRKVRDAIENRAQRKSRTDF